MDVLFATSSIALSLSQLRDNSIHSIASSQVLSMHVILYIDILCSCLCVMIQFSNCYDIVTVFSVFCMQESCSPRPNCHFSCLCSCCPFFGKRHKEGVPHAPAMDVLKLGCHKGMACCDTGLLAGFKDEFHNIMWPFFAYL